MRSSEEKRGCARSEGEREGGRMRREGKRALKQTSQVEGGREGKRAAKQASRDEKWMGKTCLFPYCICTVGLPAGAAMPIIGACAV